MDAVGDRIHRMKNFERKKLERVGFQQYSAEPKQPPLSRNASKSATLSYIDYITVRGRGF
jgi:hypothetical protein